MSTTENAATLVFGLCGAIADRHQSDSEFDRAVRFAAKQISKGFCAGYAEPTAEQRSAVIAIETPHQRGANARLIAAAPDLLSALVAMVDAHAIPSSICAERPAYEAACAAIAKATGSAS